MSFFTRVSNGWELAKVSLETVNKNRSLLLFPVFSVISLILVLSTFAGGSFFIWGERIGEIIDNEQYGGIAGIAIVFAYYLVNYFIIVYFNAALIFCAVKILNGESATPSDGLSFANSRIGKIFGWSVLSATVGTLLQLLQQAGKIGEFVAALFGIAWSILTFFAVPVLIFENRGVFETVKESGRLMKEKWGESLTANVSFGVFHFLGFVVAILAAILLWPVHPIVGIGAGLLIVLLVSTFMATAQTVFVAAMYNHVSGNPVGNFDDGMLDSMFIRK